MEQLGHSRRPGGSPALRGGAGLAGALLIAGSIIGWTAAGRGIGGASAAPVNSAAPSSVTAAAAGRTIGAGGDSYAGVVDLVSPAVVTIKSERNVKAVSQQIPDDLFRQFFGESGQGRRSPRMMPQPDQREGALGSGVIVRSDGYILTNHHVVDGADQVTVELTDGRIFKAKVVGSDQPSDLAVVKIDGSNLHTLTLGNSDAVRVGDVVLAVGNPLGVGQTVTMGIVSAKGRATGETGTGSFEDFIQTDAPINHGNSGGALVSTKGELVGINSQILSPSGGNIGIGFSIPANMARNVMTQLIDKGQVHRGMIGVTIQPVTSDIARSLGLDQVRGALVSDVSGGSPAEKAGVHRGDVITTVDGQTVKDGNELRNHVAETMPGSTVKLGLIRAGKEQTVSVTLSELKARDAAEPHGSSTPDSTGFGMTVEPLTPDTARQLGVTATGGVVVTGVQPDSKAADAGLKEGDVIEAVDGTALKSVDALRAALKPGTKPALLLVHRGADTRFITIERGDR
ncbi:MAG: DegQ family serine endoprotease [Acidobacteriota bacterium]